MVQNFGLNCPYARWQCFFFFFGTIFSFNFQHHFFFFIRYYPILSLSLSQIVNLYKLHFLSSHFSSQLNKKS